MLTRRYMERKPQKVGYFHPENGRLLIPDIGRFDLAAIRGKSISLAEGLVHAVAEGNIDVLYLMPSLGKWNDPRGRYPGKLDWEATGLRLEAYYRDHAAIIAMADKKIDIIPMDRWFSSKGIYLSNAYKAMEELKRLLNDNFQIAAKGKQFPIELLATPARTGMDLLKRKLPFDARYEPLPDDIEHIIMSEFSQARVELFNHGNDQADDVHLYDGRWMYASCLRHVPIGRIIHDEKSEWAGYVPGFYRVQAFVPRDWSHIGILPFQGGYPNEPGEMFVSWCSDKELRLAIDCGWNFDIEERILWPDTHEKEVVGKDPLRHWGETLVRLREEGLGYLDHVTSSLLKDALRNILLMTVGSLHRSKRMIDQHAESLADMPDGDFSIEEIEDDGSVHIRAKEELTRYQKEQFMPHWALYIWSQAKVKVTKAALTVPYDQLLAIRTDGIWTIGKQTFEDTGKVGCFREKPLIHRGPFHWPKTENDIRRLMQSAKGE